MSAGPFQTRKATKEDSKLKMFIRYKQNTTVHISRSRNQSHSSYLPMLLLPGCRCLSSSKELRLVDKSLSLASLSWPLLFFRTQRVSPTVSLSWRSLLAVLVERWFGGLMPLIFRKDAPRATRCSA